jgi:hypothetical protein
MVEIDVRPNWKEQPPGDSLTGKGVPLNGPLARRYHSQGAEHLGTAEVATQKEAIEKGGRAVRHSARAAQSDCGVQGMGKIRISSATCASWALLHDQCRQKIPTRRRGSPEEGFAILARVERPGLNNCGSRGGSASNGGSGCMGARQIGCIA